MVFDGTASDSELDAGGILRSKPGAAKLARGAPHRHGLDQLLFFSHLIRSGRATLSPLLVSMLQDQFSVC